MTTYCHDHHPAPLHPGETVADRLLTLMAGERLDRDEGCSLAFLASQTLDFADDLALGQAMRGLLLRGEVERCEKRGGSVVVKYRTVESVTR